MPNVWTLNKSKECSKDTENNHDTTALQLDGQGAITNSLPDDGGGLPTGGDNDRLFSFIREEHLQEAQEFRRIGHNRQVPEVDPRLVTQLHEALRKVRTQIFHHITVSGPLGSMWLQGQIGEIERLTDKLSDDVLKSWVEHEVPGKRSGETDEEGAELGSRRTAQSLVRRLESTLQTLIRVVDTLRAIDDHSTPETRAALLITELASVLSSYDKGLVTQALERIKSEDTSWSSLMQARAAAWEATDKAAAIRAMTKTTQHEAEKAKRQADKLPRNSEPRTFFRSVGAYLELLSVELIKASGSISQVTSSPFMPHDNYNADTLLSRLDHLPQRFTVGVRDKKLITQIVLAEGRNKGFRLARTIRPLNNSDEAKSIIRSILWQWQQPAIKIQYASGAILSKVKELKQIKEMFSSDAVTYDKESQQEGQETSVSHPGKDDLDMQVRQWVNDSLEQAKPENQQAEHLAVLNKLLDGDIENARALVERLRETAESMQDLLRVQRFAVLKMITRLSGLGLSLREVDTLLPKVAKDLTVSLAALEKAYQAADIRDFAKAQEQANYAQLRATEVKVGLSEKSTQLTGRPLDDLSRGSRLAKHWASLAREQRQSNEPPPDAEKVFSSLKQQGLLEGVISSGDPEGYLFATRLAGELENASNNELRLPMSPEQYSALEKGLVEYIVKWGQKRASRGIARIIIELSFEQGLDVVSFSVSGLFRIPYKVLKASIKIPYQVTKVNRYTMPGQDKPYKAIYGLMEKKLKQLGFNLLTAPVPGVIKLPVGAGITAAASLYNYHIGNREKTFSAVYERLMQGEKSGKIKMQSAGDMLFDTVLDATTMAAFKGTRTAMGAGKSEHNARPDNSFVNERVLAKLDQIEAEQDITIWENTAENERETEPGLDAMPSGQQTEVEEFSDESDQASREPRAGRRRRFIEQDLPDDPVEPISIKERLRLLNNEIKSESYVAWWVLDKIWRATEDSQEVVNSASLPISERDAIFVRKYIQLVDDFINRYPERHYMSYIKLYCEKIREIELLKTYEDNILRDGERVLREYAKLNHPIMNLIGYMDSHIIRIVAAINDTRGTQFPLDPNHKISIDLTHQVFNRGGNPKFVRKVYMTRSYTLREIVTGQFRVDLNKNLSGDQPKAVYKNANEEYLVDVLWGVNLEEVMRNELKEFRGAGNIAQKNGLRSMFNQLADIRGYEYLASKNPKYRSAVEKFLEGSNQAREVFFNGIVVQGVFMIPDGEYSGVLFHINRPGFFEVDISGPHYGRGPWGIRRHGPVYFPKLPDSPELRKWILDGMPAVEANQYKHASFSGTLSAGAQPRHGLFGAATGVASRETRPITFLPTRDRTHFGVMVFHRMVENLEQDIDRMVHTVGEATTDLWLERAKITLGIGSTILSIAVPGVGSTAGRVGLFITSLLLDAGYVSITVLQAQNAETPEEAEAYYQEAIIAGGLSGMVHLGPGFKLYRQGARGALMNYQRLKLASNKAVPKVLANMRGAKLRSYSDKINLMKPSVASSERAGLKSNPPPLRGPNTTYSLDTSSAATTSGTRLRTVSDVLGPESSIIYTGGRGSHTMVVRAHGAVGTVNDQATHNVAVFLREHTEASGMNMASVNMIDLQSCYSGLGGRYSTAQIMSNKLGKNVRGYRGKFSERLIHNNPAAGKVFRPMSSDSSELLNPERGHQCLWQFGKLLRRIRRVWRRVPRSVADSRFVETSVPELNRDYKEFLVDTMNLIEGHYSIASFAEKHGINVDALTDLMSNIDRRADMDDEEFLLYFDMMFSPGETAGQQGTVLFEKLLTYSEQKLIKMPMEVLNVGSRGEGSRGDALSIDYSILDGQLESSANWVGVYRVDSIPGIDEPVLWKYIEGSSGSIDIDTSLFDEGEYTTRFFYDGSYNELGGHMSFYVK